MREKGFSLLELLIVVVVIGIIAAIAVPNLLTARRASNEGSAISSLRTLHSAQITYASTVGAGEFAGTANTQDLSGLAALRSAGLIDAVMAQGFKSGYRIVGERIPSSASTLSTFYFSSNPSTPTGIAQTGMRRIGIGTNGVMKADATPGDLAIPFDAVSLAAANPLNN